MTLCQYVVSDRYREINKHSCQELDVCAGMCISVYLDVQVWLFLCRPNLKKSIHTVQMKHWRGR